VLSHFVWQSSFSHTVSFLKASACQICPATGVGECSLGVSCCLIVLYFVLGRNVLGWFDA